MDLRAYCGFGTLLSQQLATNRECHAQCSDDLQRIPVLTPDIIWDPNVEEAPLNHLYFGEYFPKAYDDLVAVLARHDMKRAKNVMILDVLDAIIWSYVI